MLWRAWHWLFHNLPVGAGGLLLGTPKAASSAGWTSACPSASLHRASAWVPAVLVTLSWTPSTLSMSFLYWTWGHKRTQCSKCSVMTGVETDNRFPGSTAYALVNTPGPPGPFLQRCSPGSQCPGYAVAQGSSSSSQVQSFAFVLAEFHKIPVSLFRSLWMAALPSSVSTSPFQSAVICKLDESVHHHLL